METALAQVLWDHHPYPAPQGPLCHKSQPNLAGKHRKQTHEDATKCTVKYLGKKGLIRHQLKERLKNRTPGHRISPDFTGKHPLPWVNLSL